MFKLVIIEEMIKIELTIYQLISLVFIFNFKVTNLFIVNKVNIIRMVIIIIKSFLFIIKIIHIMVEMNIVNIIVIEMVIAILIIVVIS